MSNRQARREQSRGARQQQRPTRTNRPAPPKKPSGNGPDFLSRPYLLGVAGLIIVLAAILVFVSTRGGGSSDTAQKVEAAHAEFPADLEKGASVGKADAPVKLVEYEDFQCPFCLKYTANEEPALLKEYVKTGKLQITYKHLAILGLESVKAAAAGYCAAQQDKFWEYKYLLFHAQAEAGQDTSEKVNVGRLSDDKLKAFASQAGVDRTKFDACFTSDDTTKAITDQQREANSLGIKGTPGFTINGQAVSQGNMTIEEWRKTLDAAITKASAATPAASASPAASPSAAASPPAAASASPTKAP